MKHFDVIVLGLTRAGMAVADGLASTGKSVAVVSLSDNDDRFDQLMDHLNHGQPARPEPVRFTEFKGPAEFKGPKEIDVRGERIAAGKMVLATGADVKIEEHHPEDLSQKPWRLSSDQTLISGQAVVHGQGPLAILLAHHLKSSGADVSIIFGAERILPDEDETLSAALSSGLQSKGIRIYPSIEKMSVIQSHGPGLIQFQTHGIQHQLEAQSFYLTNNLAPLLEGLQLEKAGILIRNGCIAVNDELATSNPNIYALGHAVMPGCALATQDHHADIILSNLTSPFWAKKRLMPSTEPIILRISPPVARIGLTESAAREAHHDVVSASAPVFDGSHSEQGTGLIKLIGRRRRGQLLGAHMVGKGAIELMQFFDLLIRSELPLSDIPDRQHFPIPGPNDAAYRALLAWVAAAD